MRDKPNLADPATLGRLMAQVRTTWGCHAEVTHNPIYPGTGADNGFWTCGIRAIDETGVLRWNWHHFSAPTEGEALIKALLAAPTTENDQ
jgi:hypothetical protein